MPSREELEDAIEELEGGDLAAIFAHTCSVVVKKAAMKQAIPKLVEVDNGAGAELAVWFEEEDWSDPEPEEGEGEEDAA